MHFFFNIPTYELTLLLYIQDIKRNYVYILGRYAGTADYYEPYDPDVVAQSGHSVVTTETLPVEALCFLCGSASSEAGSEEEMLLCKSCCEPYHPFCLNPEELPQTSEGQINWVCRKCIQCQICGRNEGDRMRCCKCTQAFHAQCLLPSQQKLIAQVRKIRKV